MSNNSDGPGGTSKTGAQIQSSADHVARCANDPRCSVYALPVSG
jgi:hypothetical protein